MLARKTEKGLGNVAKKWQRCQKVATLPKSGHLGPGKVAKNWQCCHPGLNVHLAQSTLIIVTMGCS